MTKFEKIKLMNIEELVAWFDSHDCWEDMPWTDWWNKKYCGKCESEYVRFKDCNYDIPCGWCEIHKKCKHFQDLDDVPSSAEIIKMWLESEADE